MHPSWVFFPPAPVVCWNVSSRLLDFHKDTLIHGSLSKLVFFVGEDSRTFLFYPVDDITSSLLSSLPLMSFINILFNSKFFRIKSTKMASFFFFSFFFLLEIFYNCIVRMNFHEPLSLEVMVVLATLSIYYCWAHS